jgi:hypothetical protein
MDDSEPEDQAMLNFQNASELSDQGYGSFDQCLAVLERFDNNKDKAIEFLSKQI